MHGLRYPLVVVVIVVVLGALLGGQWLYSRYYVEAPILQSLEKIPGVQNVQVSKDTSTVNVKLGKVEDLQETYLLIEKQLVEHEKSTDYQIKITDSRNEALEEAYYQSQFAVHQAIVQGDFVNMNHTISEVAKDSGLDQAKVYVDNENVYVQFQQGDNYLYQVVSRSIVSSAGAGANGSGE